MESGPESKLSETQTPEFVEAGALRPWTTGDLPPAPEGGLAYWKKAVGPGLLLAGASLGSGEWLFGPAVTAQYGAVLLWLAFLSIATQRLDGRCCQRRAAHHSHGNFSSGIVSIKSGLRNSTLLTMPSFELITGSSCSILSTPS